MVVDWKRVRKIALLILIVCLVVVFFFAYLHYLDFKKVVLKQASDRATFILG